MLQTSEKRRAVGEAHRALRDFREFRASLRHLSAATVQSGRRTNSLTALTQATEFHPQAVSEIPMWEAFQHRVGAFVQPPFESREYPSFMPMVDNWRTRIVSDRGMTPTVLETGIEGIAGPSITVPTHDDADPTGGPVKREELAQRPPRTFEFALSGDLARYGLSLSLEAGVEATPVVHSFPSYTWSGPRDPSVGPPRPARETDETAAPLGYFTGIGREGGAGRIWEYAIRRSTAPSKPDPVEVFSHIPPQLEALFRKIEELPEDWNSYGAARISPWSIAEARRIINEGMGLGLPAPAVSPASGASVSIEWQTDNADLVIDVDPQQGITYLMVNRASGVEIEGELNAGNRSEVLRKVMDF